MGQGSSEGQDEHNCPFGGSGPGFCIDGIEYPEHSVKTSDDVIKLGTEVKHRAQKKSTLHTHACAHTHVHKHARTRVWTPHIHTRVHTPHTHAHTCMHKDTFTCTHRHVSLIHAHTYLPYMHTHVHTSHTCTHTETRVSHTCTRTHRHILTYAQHAHRL